MRVKPGRDYVKAATLVLSEQAVPIPGSSTFVRRRHYSVKLIYPLTTA